MKICNGCSEPLERLKWNMVLCRKCNYMMDIPGARPPYLARPRDEHLVFQDMGQNHAHALARELWKYAVYLEHRIAELERPKPWPNSK